MNLGPALLRGVLRGPRKAAARTSRALIGLLILTGLLALAATGWNAWRARQGAPAPLPPTPPRASAPEEAETRALRERFISAGDASHRAWIANTPPDVRKAQEAKALEEFRAAQNEVLLQQALAAQRRSQHEGKGAPEPVPAWVQAASAAQSGGPAAVATGAAPAMPTAPAASDASPATPPTLETGGIEAMQLKALQEMARKAQAASAPGPSNAR